MSGFAVFPLVAAVVTMFVMSVGVSVLVSMSGSLMAVLVAIVSMRCHFVGMFVLMFVLGMAAHSPSLLSLYFLSF